MFQTKSSGVMTSLESGKFSLSFLIQEKREMGAFPIFTGLIKTSIST
jgi:hypothetical protein